MSTRKAARPSSTCTCTCSRGIRSAKDSARALPPRAVPAPRAAVPTPAPAGAPVAVVVVVVVQALGPQVDHVGRHARVAIIVLADLARLVAVDLPRDGELAAGGEHFRLVEAVAAGKEAAVAVVDLLRASAGIERRADDLEAGVKLLGM